MKTCKGGDGEEGCRKYKTSSNPTVVVAEGGPDGEKDEENTHSNTDCIDRRKVNSNFYVRMCLYW